MLKNTYEEKRKAKDVIKYEGVKDLEDNRHCDLTGAAPENYSSSFSNLKYEDVG